MHLKSFKYSPKYSGSKIAHHSNLSPSLDSTIAEWSRISKRMLLTRLICTTWLSIGARFEWWCIFWDLETLSEISFIHSSGKSLSQPLRDDINVISVVFVYFLFFFLDSIIISMFTKTTTIHTKYACNTKYFDGVWVSRIECHVKTLKAWQHLIKVHSYLKLILFREHLCIT